ncbi:MAG: hypothetical protein ACT4O9_15635 [Blastocatellia bacterium]
MPVKNTYRAYRKETFNQEFTLESYGVRVRIESSDPKLLETARLEIEKALIGRLKYIEKNRKEIAGSYGIERGHNRQFDLFLNGEHLSSNTSLRMIMKMLNTLVRTDVSQYAVGKIFIHAGVVAKNGRAIIIPGSSFKGKTTLVKDLVRYGAEYLSDEYAIVDRRGMIHPFPRELATRIGKVNVREKEISVESIGGVTAKKAVRAHLVLITEYSPNAVWKPKELSQGQGVMELIPHTIPFAVRQEESMNNLKRMTNGVKFLKGKRGNSRQFAKFILSFFDNCVN